MKADSITLQKLLEPTIRYKIPLFQRPYVWTRSENWKPIWLDVKRLSESLLRTDTAPPHFLGAIVLAQELRQTGEIESRQVIDGQQRLTTLQLMLAAFRDLAIAHDCAKIAKRFDKLTTNDESFVVEDEDSFKVWPTNRDRRAYSRVLSAGSVDAVYKRFRIRPKQKNIQLRIPGAYIYFYRRATEWLEDEFRDKNDNVIDLSIDERFDALWTVIRSHLLLVAIDLEDEDDAQVIFETLNARGTQLLPADLVKNYLFHLSNRDESQLEALYKQYWKHFDNEFWREEIRQGRIKRPRIDLFLQYYLTLKTMDEVPVNNVFSYFKNYVENCTQQGIGKDTEGGPASFHLEQLTLYGKVFRSLLSIKSERRLGKFFQRLRVVDTATIYPLILEIFHDLDHPNSRADLRKYLVMLESFLIRRMICGLTNKNYNRLFLDILRLCRVDGKMSFDAGQRYLQQLDGDSVRWPDDKELRSAMLDRHLYRKLSQRKLRMLLLSLEHKMEDGKTEPVIYSNPSKLTIEHIMPQAWQKHWPLPAQEDSDDTDERLTAEELAEEREEYIHVIGNLTLLTNKLNPSLSARNWAYKKSQLLAKSKMNLNRSFAEVEEWDEDAIEERSQDLYQLAIKIWPYRSASANTLTMTEES